MVVWRDARAQFHYRLANLLLRLHRYESAANSYERVLRIRPDDAHVQFQRAWCLLEVPGRHLDGITGFQKLLRQSPSAGGYYLLACGLQKEARHEEAVEAFRETGRLEDSGTADFFHNYAVSLEALRHFEESADAYRHAAQLNPSDAEAWGNLGAVLARLGRWKDAAPCQERAMRLAPSLAHGLGLGSTLYELNRLEEAERVLRDALVHDPQSVDGKELLAQVLAGQDRYEEAIKLAREICERYPDALSSRVVLAGVLSEAGHLEEALKEARAAAEVAPADPRSQSALGAIYVKMNDGVRALSAFERMAVCLDSSMERLPSSAWVWCDAGRGAALSLLGRHDEALATFDKLLRTDPEFFERWPEVAPHYDLSSRQAGGHSVIDERM
ncbi:MAG: tetratricopeptide repeat protein [Bryobacteraceae bacterium]